MRKSEGSVGGETIEKGEILSKRKKLWLLCLMTNKKRRKLQKIAGIN